MKTTDKILSCCSWGCNRSVHLKYALNLRGYNRVVSLGLDYTDTETVSMLCAWADVIVVPESHLTERVPEMYRYKVQVLPIGEDRWGGWQRNDLLSLIESCLESIR